MQRIAVLTSGGDAPGMNAAIRAVVRTGLDRGLEVFGVRARLRRPDLRGWSPHGRDVGGILPARRHLPGQRAPARVQERGGTARRRSRTSTGAASTASVVIGGNGSQSGALSLSQMGFPVVGVASTIDNDLEGTEITIGVDTALNIALEAIDRLKVTASSHQRAFLVEVMGRNCGYLALMAGIAGGAEAIVIPEADGPRGHRARAIRGLQSRQEQWPGGGRRGRRVQRDAPAGVLRGAPRRLGFDLRVTTLGHVQRGGAPGAFDRLLASRLGSGATEALARGEHGVLMGLIKSEIVPTPLAEVVSKKKPLDMRLIELAAMRPQSSRHTSPRRAYRATAAS